MNTVRLNQIIAVVQGKKTRTTRAVTEAHHGWASELFTGISRTYTPNDADDTETLPPESKRVQKLVRDVVKEATEHLANLWDAVATQEYGNCEARADIKIGDEIILDDVPVGVLLFLEKQLTDLHTFVSGMPVLPDDREWDWDGTKGCYAADTVWQNRTRKTPKNHVKFEPTEHQPGQAEVYMVDAIVGKWNILHYSGCVPAEDKKETVERVEHLREAVKKAREQANTAEVEQRKIAEPVLAYALAALK